MEFKDRLKILRKQKNITQGDLAQILNYGYTAISNYESGRNEPSITDLKKIAEFFDVSMDYLMCVNDIKNPYKPGDENAPDDDFLNKYASLSVEGKAEVKSYLEYVLMKDTSSNVVSLNAAQKTSTYKTKNSKK